MTKRKTEIHTPLGKVKKPSDKTVEALEKEIKKLRKENSYWANRENVYTKYLDNLESRTIRLPFGFALIKPAK